MKIVLGTVQFGMDYGVSNTSGKVPITEIAKILDFCKSHKITTLDTAQGYGDSEKVLGNFDLSGFRIITKLIGDAALETSLENLKVDSVYGLMFHRENECNDESWKLFESYKAQGLVKKIGVSVYSPVTLEKLVECYPIEIVQLPMNILDQRFVPLLPTLKQKNIEIHIRSCFLQGLLLMESVPDFFSSVKTVIDDVPKPRLEHCINFGKCQKEIDSLVFGVTQLKDLEEIYDAFSESLPETDYSKFSINDEKYINPSLWEINK